MTSNVINLHLARLAKKSRESSRDEVVDRNMFDKFMDVSMQQCSYDHARGIWYQMSYSPVSTLYSGTFSQIISDLVLDCIYDGGDPDEEMSCAIEEIEDYLINLRRFRTDFRQFEASTEVQTGRQIRDAGFVKPRIRIRAGTTYICDEAISSGSNQGCVVIEFAPKPSVLEGNGDH